MLQIPEEEKNLGPHDRLIHVYHFMKDPNQNQMVNTDWKFCLYVICCMVKQINIIIEIES